MEKNITPKLIFLLFSFLFLLVQGTNAQLCTDPPASLDCGDGVSTILVSEDFEVGIGNFVQSTTDNLEWLQNNGPTTSIQTGPSDDACGGGNYLYVEASSFPAQEGDVACISTEVNLTSLSATDPAIASFWYHAFGQCIGEFTVTINGGASVFTITDQVQTVTTDAWEQQAIDLDGFQGTNVTLEFCYVLGTNDVDGCVDFFNGDFAIDQFMVWSCIPPCEITCPADLIVPNDPGQCSATIDGVTIGTTSFMGGCIGPDAINDYTGTADAGGVYPIDTTTITWTIYGIAGDSATCTQNIIVVDEEAPVLDCPSSATYFLDGGECVQGYYFSTSATDNCPGDFETIPDPAALAGYNAFESGDFLPIGEHCFQYVATDAVGNQSTCSWCITVEEYPDPISTLSCNSNLNHAVNLDCEFIVSPDMILEGGPYGCYEDYIVTVIGVSPATAVVANETNAVTIIAAEVDGFLENGIAGPFEIKITDPETGVSCWGYGHMIEDKTAPSIQCDTVEIECTADTNVGEPVVTENCGDYTLTFEDNEIAGACGNQYATVIERTWTVSDNIGNTDQCVQVINVKFADIAEIIFPLNYDNIEEPALSCENPDTDPSNTGEPTGDSCPNIGYTHSDSDPIELCNGGSNSFKIIRTWTVLDWCTGEIITDQQVIKVLDEVAPEITCPATMEVSTSNASCEATVLIPANSINVSDACSETIALSATISDGTIVQNAANWTASGLEIGTHSVTFTATDECGNTTSCSFDIIVSDGINPTAICETFHTVSLTTNSPTLVYANVFDANSHDNCGPITMAVQRMESCIDFDWTTDGGGADENPNSIVNDADRGTGNANSQTLGWYAAIPVACCDVGTNVEVAFRVTDGAGNSNTCMVNLEVMDETAATVACPGDQDFDCSMDILEPSDIALDAVSTTDNGGYPTYYFDGTGWEFVGYYLNAFDNCGANVFIYDRGGINGCGESYFNNEDVQAAIRRSYVVYPASIAVANVSTIYNLLVSQSDDVCMQFLNVENPYEFDVNDITFPSDVTVSCPTVPGNTGFPIVNDGFCSNIAVTQESDIFLPINGDSACYKILRTWVVVDWCAYDGNGAGYWENEQIIKVQDNIAPSIDSDCADQDFYVNTDNDGNMNNGCTAPVQLSATGSDNCVDESALEWTWTVDENNDGTIDEFGTGNSLSGTYTSGSHRINWILSDGCNNVDQCTYLFNVIDNTGPLVYGDNGLEVALVDQGGGGGIATILATGFDEGSSDECSGICDMRIASPSMGGGQLIPPTSTSVSFDCTKLGNNSIDFWVKDCANNWRYISTFVNILPGTADCSEVGLSITGAMETEVGEGVEGVDVNLSGFMTNTIMTGDDGQYGFYALPETQNYSLTPSEDLPVLNGVSTYDLVLISKHILGIEQLDSPYKIIAADVNSSGTITTFDMVELRKLILFIASEFPVDNSSWRFVPADFVFPDPTNPWVSGTSFPELHSVNDLIQSELANFIAIKKGDVNNSAVPNSLLGGDDRSTVGTLSFEVDDLEMQAGETYTVDFRAKEFNQLFGYQFSLKYDENTVEFVDLSAGNLINLNEDNFGLSLLNEGVLTTSWNNQLATDFEEREIVFSLRFKALENTSLSKVLQIGSRYTVAEAYNENLELLNVVLNIKEDPAIAAETSFKLLQNQPNPFKNETVIGFTLAKAEAVSLTVFDIRGQVLSEKSGVFESGYNEIVIHRHDLNTTGVLYYQLDTNEGSATAKMILME